MLSSFVLVNILINHFYGTDVVGIYALSYAIAQIGILGIGSVYSLLIRRDLSVGDYDVRHYVAKVQILRSGNLAVILVFAALGILFFYPELRINLGLVLLMIIAKGFDALSETYYTAYQTTNRLTDYSVLKITNAVAFIGISFFICASRYEIHYLYWVQAGFAVLMFVVNLVRWEGLHTLRLDRLGLAGPEFRYLLSESYPLMINAMIFQLGVRANNILVFDKLGERDLGVFSLVVITVSVFAGVANTLAIVFFGRLSKIFADDPDIFFKRLHQTIALFLFLGTVFFCVYLLLVPLIEKLFNLGQAKQFYALMAAAIPFMFIASCLGYVFTIIRKQKAGMYLAGVILAVNLSAYYLLTGRFGLMGAAYAFLVSAIFQSVIIYCVMLISLKRSSLKDHVNITK